MPSKKPIKLDVINRKILATIHLHGDITNARLAEVVNLSAAAIEVIPEFMDCLRLTGETDYISFTCCSSVPELNRLCDELSANEDLKIQRIVTRLVLERPKFYLGYPIAKLKWLE